MKTIDELSEKLKDEMTVTENYISVDSIGSVEFALMPDSVKLFKRNQENQPINIAKLKRVTGEGWKFYTTPSWSEMKLPHLGHIEAVNTDFSGMKTHGEKLESIMKKFGIRYDELKPFEFE